VAVIAAGRKIAPGAILGNLTALAAGLAVTLLLGEILLRLLGLGHPYYSAPELYRPSEDPRILFEPRPSFDGFSEGTWVQTNTRGLRERELSTEKPPGVTRLLFLGDSVTFGAGVRDDESFPRLLEAALAGGGSGRVETLNAGVVGYNTTQELARLQTVGLEYRPDVVVLTFVVNDLLDAFSIFDHQYDPTGLFADQKIWLRRNSHLYRFVQNTYWRVALAARRIGSEPTAPLRRRERVEERLGELRAIADTARAHGAAFFLVLYPDNLDDPVSPNPSGERLTVRQELLGLAERSGYPVVDLTAALGDVRDPRARQFRLGEDPHPSPAGHRAIADALSAPLRSLLAGLPRP
jgi:lysophospholipase L1-like esterase